MDHQQFIVYYGEVVAKNWSSLLIEVTISRLLFVVMLENGKFWEFGFPIRDAHERENLVRTNPEQMLTCSNGEERSEHIGLGLGLILWNTKTGRVQQIPVISFEKIPKMCRFECKG